MYVSTSADSSVSLFEIYNSCSCPCFVSVTMVTSSLRDWVSNNLLGGSEITPEIVAGFVEPGVDGVSHVISELTESELVWLLVLDMIEKKKYKEMDMSKQQKMFIVQAQYGFASLPLEINFDLLELWEKSGC